MRNVHSKIELVTMLATPAAYRIMQRSSSCKEPRHPLIRVLTFLFDFFVILYLVLKIIFKKRIWCCFKLELIQRQVHLPLPCYDFSFL